MQALARETNLSETTFVLPRSATLEQERGVSVRIFTAEQELPFAGHPTLGTAAWIHDHYPGLADRSMIQLELASGPIEVRFDVPAGESAGVFGTMRQKDPAFGQEHDRAAVAEVLGLTADDLDPELPPQTVSTGLPFCIVPLRSLEVAARLAVPQQASTEYLRKAGARWFYCTTRAAPGSGADWHARMQFNGREDPATGSASGCAIAYLVRHGAVASQAPTVFEQGVEIHRPSRIHVQAKRQGEQVSDVFVGGRTILVASGQFFLP